MEEPGYVYLIEAVGSGCFKIGRSQQFEARLQSLQTASPFPLRIRKHIQTDNAAALEKYLHTRYAEYRRHGEWFEIPPDFLRWLLLEDFCDSKCWETDWRNPINAAKSKERVKRHLAELQQIKAEVKADNRPVQWVKDPCGNTVPKTGCPLSPKHQLCLAADGSSACEGFRGVINIFVKCFYVMEADAA